MKYYETKKPVYLNSGMVSIGAQQYKIRKHLLTVVREPSEANGEETHGIYKVNATIVFKVGEVFGYSEELSKAELLYVVESSVKNESAKLAYESAKNDALKKVSAEKEKNELLELQRQLDEIEKKEETESQRNKK